MKALPWIVGAAALAAAYVILNRYSKEPRLGFDPIDDVAEKASIWGTKQRIAGAGEGLMGKVKEGLGDAVGNHGLAAEGFVDQAKGLVRDTTGAVAATIGKAVHEGNS